MVLRLVRRCCPSRCRARDHGGAFEPGWGSRPGSAVAAATGSADSMWLPNIAGDGNHGGQCAGDDIFADAEVVQAVSDAEQVRRSWLGRPRHAPRSRDVPVLVDRQALALGGWPSALHHAQGSVRQPEPSKDQVYPTGDPRERRTLAYIQDLAPTSKSDRLQ
jgi:hypothetical protein